VVDNSIPVDYAISLKLAKVKAHEHILNKIINEELLHCSDVYTNLLDTTKIGIREAKKNKANLSANSEYIQDIKEKIPPGQASPL
jgi:hypothetical protein